MQAENTADASLICEECGQPIARPGEVVVRTGRVFHPACMERGASRPSE